MYYDEFPIQQTLLHQKKYRNFTRPELTREQQSSEEIVVSDIVRFGVSMKHPCHIDHNTPASFHLQFTPHLHAQIPANILLN